jgi:hypothetical protein
MMIFDFVTFIRLRCSSFAMTGCEQDVEVVSITSLTASEEGTAPVLIGVGVTSLGDIRAFGPRS